MIPGSPAETTLQPVRLERDAGGHPVSTLYGDVYASRAGALGQAVHVFLGGCGLPSIWRGRHQFVVLEAGFGLGLNFMVTWQAWRDDAQRPARLHYVAVELHPVTADDLVAAAPAALGPMAQALARQWPPPLAGLHRLEFEGGRVVLTLALGDARRLLPRLVVGADAIYLDGFAPARNPQMWEPALLKAIGRCARPGARLATYTTARAVRDALASAGFELEVRAGYADKREMLAARYAPRWRTRRHEPPTAYAGERTALVVGAGLAGSACAHALARRGWRVQVLERGLAPAVEASALPWGLLHPQFAIDDAPLARLTRAGAAAALATLARTSALHGVHGEAIACTHGAFQIAPDDATFDRWRQAIAARALPPDFVVALDAAAAHELIGLRPRRGGVWWPRGSVVSPARWCAVLLEGSRLLPGMAVQRLARRDGRWMAMAADGRIVASAAVAVIAAAMESPTLLGLGHAQLRAVRGRVAQLAPAALAGLRAPLAGDGTLLPDPAGGRSIGATYEVALEDGSEGLSAAQARASNLARAAALLAEPPALTAIGDFEGVRCVSHDRLPFAGAVPDEAAASAAAPLLRGAQLQDVPRQDGAYACFALGSRGLTLAPLLGELIAARIEGEPLPVESDLAAAVDPARFLLQSLRRGLLRGPPAPISGTRAASGTLK